jgi:hypothetical protein
MNYEETARHCMGDDGVSWRILADVDVHADIFMMDVLWRVRSGVRERASELSFQDSVVFRGWSTTAIARYVARTVVRRETEGIH